MPFENSLSRRSFMLGSVGLTASLAGCSAMSQQTILPVAAQRPIGPPDEAELQARYAAVEDGGHMLPAIPFHKINPKYYRQRVIDPLVKHPELWSWIRPDGSFT